MARDDARRGPPLLGDTPVMDEVTTALYAFVSACQGSTVSRVWLPVRSLLKAAREADHPAEGDLLHGLAAAIGECIADLPAERQQAMMQETIHLALTYAAELRTPGFDQPHGAAGHA